jgi:hypothetical protein
MIKWIRSCPEISGSGSEPRPPTTCPASSDLDAACGCGRPSSLLHLQPGALRSPTDPAAAALQRTSVSISFTVDGGAEHNFTATYASSVADFGPMASLFPYGLSAMDFSMLEFTRIDIDGTSYVDPSRIYNLFRVLLLPPVGSRHPPSLAAAGCPVLCPVGCPVGHPLAESAL